MMFNIDEALRDRAAEVTEPDYTVCSDTLYADDTVLLSASAGKLQALLDLIIEEDKKDGLELNWKKTVLMQVRNSGRAYAPSGE
eukprot:3921998-Pyramimonas_sp.AAC.1